jgi:hypothetical protein
LHQDFGGGGGDESEGNGSSAASSDTDSAGDDDVPELESDNDDDGADEDGADDDGSDDDGSDEGGSGGEDAGDDLQLRNQHRSMLLDPLPWNGTLPSSRTDFSANNKLSMRYPRRRQLKKLMKECNCYTNIAQWTAKHRR